MKARSPARVIARLTNPAAASVACATRRLFRSALILLSVSCTALSLGCVANEIDDAPLLTSGERLELRAEESGMSTFVELEGSVVRGDNAFTVTLSDPEAELTAVSALMPAHGHDTGAPDIERSEDRYSVAGLSLFMPGRWDVTLALEVQAKADRAVFSVDVP
jgi:hypothetical protein